MLRTKLDGVWGFLHPTRLAVLLEGRWVPISWLSDVTIEYTYTLPPSIEMINSVIDVRIE